MKKPEETTKTTGGYTGIPASGRTLSPAFVEAMFILIEEGIKKRERDAAKVAQAAQAAQGDDEDAAEPGEPQP